MAAGRQLTVAITILLAQFYTGSSCNAAVAKGRFVVCLRSVPDADSGF